MISWVPRIEDECGGICYQIELSGYLPSISEPPRFGAHVSTALIQQHVGYSFLRLLLPHALGDLKCYDICSRMSKKLIDEVFYFLPP
jgi:hypothetical protein